MQAYIQIKQHTHTAVIGCVETKRLRSRQKQSDFYNNSAQQQGLYGLAQQGSMDITTNMKSYSRNNFWTDIQGTPHHGQADVAISSNCLTWLLPGF